MHSVSVSVSVTLLAYSYIISIYFTIKAQMCAANFRFSVGVLLLNQALVECHFLRLLNALICDGDLADGGCCAPLCTLNQN